MPQVFSLLQILIRLSRRFQILCITLSAKENIQTFQLILLKLQKLFILCILRLCRMNLKIPDKLFFNFLP